MQPRNPADGEATRSRTFLDRDGYYVSDEVFKAPSLNYRIDAIGSVRVVRERMSRGWLGAAIVLALAGAGLWLRIGWVPATLLAALSALALTRALYRKYCLDLVVQNTIKVRLLPESLDLLHAVAAALKQALEQRQTGRPAGH